MNVNDVLTANTVVSFCHTNRLEDWPELAALMELKNYNMSRNHSKMMLSGSIRFVYFEIETGECYYGFEIDDESYIIKHEDLLYRR